MAAIGVTACGDSGPAAPAQDEKAPLSIWIRKPPDKTTATTAKTLAAEFTKATGIPTEVTALFEDFETKLAQAAAGKKLPDIVINDTAQLGTMVKQGIVRPVNRTEIAGNDQATDLAWQATKGADGEHFESGKAGIYLTGPYNMARFDKSLGRDKYEVVPAPPGPGGKSASLAEGENVYLTAGSANEAGQQRFAEFALSAKGQTIGMAGDTDANIVRLPVNKTVKLADVRTDERWAVFEDIYRESGRYTPAVPDWTPFLQAAAETINGIVADCGSDTKSSLNDLATTFGEELDRQGVAA